jgi:hypothetical protein
VNVGDTRSHNGLACAPQADDDLSEPTCWSVPITHWLPEWDSDPVHAGLVYRYSVRGCLLATGCGQWGELVPYAAPPMACYENRKEIPCYVGDALTH